MSERSSIDERGSVAKGGGTTRLRLKVVPGSSCDAVAGWLGDVLKVRVRAPAERGRANASVEEILAEALGVPKQCVRIAAGAASARKVALVSGLCEAEVRRRLSQGGRLREDPEAPARRPPRGPR